MKSVGAWAFEQGKKPIEDFLTKARSHTGVGAIVTGQSLGACMSLHTAIQFPSLVAQVHAFSPAALVKGDLEIWDKEKDDPRQLTPEVHVYRQQHDRVPMFGNCWGKGWHINYVQGFQMTGPLEGHIRVGAAAGYVTISRIKETVRPSFRRSFLAAIKFVAGGIFFLIGQGVIKLAQLGRAIYRLSSSARIHIENWLAQKPKPKSDRIYATPLLSPDETARVQVVAASA